MLTGIKNGSLNKVETSDWGQHQGLAAIASWFVEHIEQQKSSRFIRSKAYKEIAKALKETYQFKKALSFDNHQILLTTYPCNADKQAIISIGLRHLLYSCLINAKNHQQTTLNQVLEAVDTVFNRDGRGTVEAALNTEFKSLFYSNIGLFLKVDQLRRARASAQEWSGFRNTVETYWKATGYKSYAEYLCGKLSLSSESNRMLNGDDVFPQLSSPELSLLANHLGLSIKVVKLGKEDTVIESLGSQSKKPVDTIYLTAKSEGWQRLSLDVDTMEQLQAQSVMVPVLAVPGVKQSHVVMGVRSTISNKVSGERLDIGSLCTSLTSALNQRNYSKVYSLLNKFPFLNNEILSATSLNERMESYDSEMLVTIMAASRAAHNLIVQEICEISMDYLSRLLAYRQQYLESNPLTNSAGPNIPPFDKYQGHDGLEETSDIRVKTWLGTERINAKGFKCVQNKISGLTALHSAIFNNDLERFETLLRAIDLRTGRKQFYFNKFFGCSDLDIPDHHGMTPLHYMARFGRMTWLSKLSKVNVLVDPLHTKPLNFALADHFGNNALHHAVILGDVSQFVILVNYIKSVKHRAHKLFNQVRQQNKDGLSPLLLALAMNRPEFAKIIIKEGLFDQQDLAELRGAIPGLIAEHENEILDMVVARHPNFVWSLHNRLSTIHLAVQCFNYQAIHILLHPLSLDERTQLVMMQNDKGLTPFHWLKNKLSSLNDSEQDQGIRMTCDKIIRLLAQYDVEAAHYVKENYRSYLYSFNQDVVSELESSRLYPTLVKLNVAFNPAIAGFKATVATGNIVAGFEAAAVSALSGDVVEKLEKMSRLALNNDSAPGFLRTGLYYGAMAYGLYSRTTQRLTQYAFSQGSAYVLNSDAAKWLLQNGLSANGLSNSYLNYVDAASLLYFAQQDVLAGRYLGPYLSEYWTGIESTLCDKLETRPVRELVVDGGKYVNGAIETQTGVNPCRTLVHSYLWLRRNIAKLEGDNTELYLKYSVMNDRELLEFMYGEPEFFRKLVFTYTPEMLVKVALDLAVGNGDKPYAVAELLSLWLVGVHDARWPLTQEQREVVKQQYLSKFLMLQQELNYQKKPEQYLVVLGDLFGQCLYSMHAQWSADLLQSHYASGQNIASLVNQIFSGLNLKDEVQDALLPVLSNWLAKYSYDYNQLYHATYMLVTACANPALNASNTLTFLSMVANGSNKNFGNAAAEVLSQLLLNAELITQENYQNTYAYLSDAFNHHYFGDGSRNKKDYYKSMQSVLEAYFETHKVDTPQNNLSFLHSTKVGVIFDKLPGLQGENLIHAYCQAIKQEMPELFEDELFESCLVQALQGAGCHDQMIKAANDLVLLCQTQQYMWQFLGQQPLTLEAKQLNNLHMPRVVRAAFAVNWLAHELEKTPGYTGLNIQTQFTFFQTLANEKQSKDFEQTVFNILADNCHTPDCMPTLSNGVDPAEFAVQVEASSHRYAQNQWHGSHPMDERSLGVADKPNKLRKLLRTLTNPLLGGQGGLQFSAGDGGLAVNCFNLYGFQLNQTPDYSLELFKESAVSGPVMIYDKPVSDVFLQTPVIAVNDSNKENVDRANVVSGWRYQNPLDNPVIVAYNKAKKRKTSTDVEVLSKGLLKPLPSEPHPLGGPLTLEEVLLLEPKPSDDPLDTNRESRNLTQRLAQLLNPVSDANAAVQAVPIIRGSMAMMTALGAVLFKSSNDDDINLIPHFPNHDDEMQELAGIPPQQDKTEDKKGQNGGFADYDGDRITHTSTQVKQDGAKALVTMFPDNPFVVGYGLYFKKSKNKLSIKQQIKEAHLPREGRIRFIPSKKHMRTGKLYVYDRGYVDKFGNIWREGSSRTEGEDFEWDVQLSKKGQAQLGWLSRDNKHINVSLKGRITHR